MKNNLKVSSFMFAAAGVLWILESIGEMFGGFVEDFNSNFDYLSEITFGLSFLALFLAGFNLVKANRSKGKIGLAGKIGIGLLTIGGCLMPIKSLATASLGFIGGYTLVSEFGTILGPIFIVPTLSILLGTIIFGASCYREKFLAKGSSLLLLISIFLVFIPVIGKYLAAAVYFFIALELYQKQVKKASVQNINDTIAN